EAYLARPKGRNKTTPVGASPAARGSFATVERAIYEVPHIRRGTPPPAARDAGVAGRRPGEDRPDHPQGAGLQGQAALLPAGVRPRGGEARLGDPRRRGLLRGPER